MSMEAIYNIKAGNDIKCVLCPHNCLIHQGKTGICKVRRNVKGKLMAETWGYPSAMHLDPIEKKPLYHFYPGRSILSLGSVGCNMHCECCQNWQISQVSAGQYGAERHLFPEEILKKACSIKDNLGVAYTYNEPTVWYEYMIDIARLIHREGLKNVMVSNGYINEEPLRELLQYIDAFNIDLKGFSDSFYRRYTGAFLDPVLRTLKQIRNAGKHLEITTLIIPSQNDNSELFHELVNWIVKDLGSDTVLHLSRYHPAYRSTQEPTSPASLEVLYLIARKVLSYVYVGNIEFRDFQDTHCARCGSLLISRTGFQISLSALNKNGCCTNCGNQVIMC